MDYTNLYINSANNPANHSDLEGKKAWFVPTQMQDLKSRKKLALKGGGNLAKKKKEEKNGN